MRYQRSYDCVVIGGGHAGVEAALAASRMGAPTLMITLSQATIGQMSCNPAIGGVGKGQLVKEIDVLGGEMGRAADRTGIQFRQLNRSKGQAVRSSRCQSDRLRYKLYIQRVVQNQENLFVLADQVREIVVRNGRVAGVKTFSDEDIPCQTVIVTTGTFLRGRIHVGESITPGGRVGEPASYHLADCLGHLGFPFLSFKTGTPPRLDGRTIDFRDLERQDSDINPIPFSFRTKRLPEDLRPCFITRTSSETHEIIHRNLHLSPMYSGRIQSTGVRYCPSIEDKVVKFKDKDTHHVFLEPEGLDTFEVYPNGISTGLPAEIQEQMIHSIKGLERARMIRPGYSIEHGVVPPTELQAHLETKKVQGLFLAGQINGTTGYEEAGCQGIVAGINAVLKVRQETPFVLGRPEAYIGVLIDDLVTKGTDEPYRMFTSRVEHRLIIREDNADRRLAHHGHRFGLITQEEFDQIHEKYAAVKREIEHLKATRIPPGILLDEELKGHNTTPLREPTLLSDLLKRPEVTYRMIVAFDGGLKNFTQQVIDQVEYEIKYEGFIERQNRMVERFRHIENIKIPSEIDYTQIPGLSTEIQEKLKRFAPVSLGQANRISGVTPAAISILMIYLRGRGETPRPLILPAPAVAGNGGPGSEARDLKRKRGHNP